MPEAVIVSALRTPIGTAMKGTLRDTDAYQLAEHVVGAAVADLDSGAIDDVILGEGLYGGGVVARHAAITAGLDLGARPCPEPALCRGSGRRAERRGQRARGDGPAHHRRRRELRVDVSAVQAPRR